MSFKKIYIAVIFLIIMFVIIFILKDDKLKKPSTIFSWKMGEETIENINIYKKDLNIDRIFQYISPDEFKDNNLDIYISRMKEKDLMVYALDGGYYWGTTEYGYDELVEFVDMVNDYNISYGNKIHGIVLDVEPAQDPTWKKNEDDLMKLYVENTIKAYKYANDKGISVVVCITNWYDEKHESLLRTLIEKGCDEVAVMNYSVGNEIEKIEREISIAKDYKKPIISIFEFDKADNKGVFNQNTYHEKGIDSAIETFEEMDDFYEYKELTPGWHQLNIN